MIPGDPIVGFGGWPFKRSGVFSALGPIFDLQASDSILKERYDEIKVGVWLNTCHSALGDGGCWHRRVVSKAQIDSVRLNTVCEGSSREREFRF